MENEVAMAPKRDTAGKFRKSATPALERYELADTGYKTPCWLWTGHVCKRDGYGSVWGNGRSVRAHRFFYEAYKGPIPVGIVTDHLCRVRRCVNPDHMEAVTQSENVFRGAAAIRLRTEMLEWRRRAESAEAELARTKAVPIQCCERDMNNDGNCHIHSAPGVFRNPQFDKAVPIGEGERLENATICDDNSGGHILKLANGNYLDMYGLHEALLQSQQREANLNRDLDAVAGHIGQMTKLVNHIAELEAELSRLRSQERPR